MKDVNLDEKVENPPADEAVKKRKLFGLWLRKLSNRTVKTLLSLTFFPTSAEEFFNLSCED